MTFRVNQIQSDKQSKFFRFCVVEVWECVENEADTKTKVSKYKFIRIYKQTNIPDSPLCYPWQCLAHFTHSPVVFMNSIIMILRLKTTNPLHIYTAISEFWTVNMTWVLYPSATYISYHHLTANCSSSWHECYYMLKKEESSQNILFPASLWQYSDQKNLQWWL